MTGNTKALTNDELKYILGKYQFNLVGDYILVLANGRKTLHDKTKGFSLLLPLERRRVKIGTDAIDLWINKFMEKYSLIEVQNAINTLIVTYQKPTNQNVEGQLERTRSKLDNLYKGE